METIIAYSRQSIRPRSKKEAGASFYPLLKKGIWAYFILLIFEGAIRKWVLPGLATPLLVVRDPIAMWLVFTCLRKGLLPRDGYLICMVVVGVLGTVTAVLVGHGNIFVAAFGARVFLFHFPLIYVIGKIFDRQDVVNIGKATIFLAIPIAVLVALQFYSPQSAWVNRAVGGDEGVGFAGALGYSRPPGPFSFSNGLSLFYGFVACFVFYFWLNREDVRRSVLLLATASLLIVIPLSISRGLFFSVMVTLLFVILASSRKPKFLRRVVVIVVAVLAVGLVLSQMSFFQTALEVFTVRFTGANESEGGVEGVLLDRYLGGLLQAFSLSYDIPFFGIGIGALTNVGTMLLSGVLVSAISEGEWSRMIQELGPLMGLIVVFVRLGVSFSVAILSYKRMSRGDLLPWLILSFCLLNLPQGMWSQPTALGFSVLSAGLVYASLRSRKKRL